MKTTDRSGLGTITFQEPTTETLKSRADPGREYTFKLEKGVWRPSADMIGIFREDFFFPVEVRTTGGGFRNLMPDCGFGLLTALGFDGGLAVKQATSPDRKELARVYGKMYLIYQYVSGHGPGNRRGMKEHWTRSFGHPEDLGIRRPGRVAYDCNDVLPDNVGLDSQGRGHRWSVDELLNIGRRAASADGHENPDCRTVIAYGLFEAAKKNPLEISDEEALALICSALFDIECYDRAPLEQTIRIVEERFLKIITRHLDDSTEEFNEWCFGPKNSLVKLITEKKKPKGDLTRHEVRQALVHLGWESYRHVGDCIHEMMETIADSLPIPLNEEERRFFAMRCQRQPCFGNLPLVLLLEHSHLLKLPVLAIWNEPGNPRHAHVLHRMIAYYADMVRTRREADRRFKPSPKDRSAKSGGKPQSATPKTAADTNRRDGIPNAYQTDSVEDEGSTPESAEVTCNSGSEYPKTSKKLAAVLRKEYGIGCDRGCTQWDCHPEPGSVDPVTIVVTCECGNVIREIEISFEELSRFAENSVS